MKNKKILLVSSILLCLFFLSYSLGTLSILNTTTLNNSELDNSESKESIQTSTSPLNKEHQIHPVSILVYNEYADIIDEFEKTLEAIDDYYRDGYYGPEYYYENLTDYTDLNTALPGHDIFLIPEQRYGLDSQMKIIGTAWATTLTDFITEGGIIISLDDEDNTHHILNQTGLFTFNGIQTRNGETMVLMNNNDALARRLDSSWTGPVGSASFDTPETATIVSSSLQPVVVHKVIGSGHVVVLGFDLSNDDVNNNYAKILANAIRLHQHIIFDNSHSQSNNIHSSFSDYAEDLVEAGFAVSSMSIFSSAYISSGDVLVVTMASDSYTSGEIDIIEAYMANGGGLLVSSGSGSLGDEIDPLINRFGFSRDETRRLEDTDDLLDGEEQMIEYDNIINHSLTLDVNSVEFYYHTGFITIPSTADVIIATDTDGTSKWDDDSPANGIPVVATLVTGGNGRIAAFSATSFMMDDYNYDGDGTNNYYDDENEELLINTIRWLSAAGVEEKVVLFDESKNPTFNLDIEYKSLGNYLTMNGYTIKWMDSFTSSLINEVDILFIVNGPAMYTTIQISVISNFVSSGGGLFLIGEVLDGENINDIATKFNMAINTTGSLRDLDDAIAGLGYIVYEEVNLAAHPITEGIKRIEVYGSPGLATSSSGTPIIITDNDDTCYVNVAGNPVANDVSIMEAKTHGYGRVILFTDFNFMSEGYDQDGDGDAMFFDSDNERLIINSFQWLSEAGMPSTGTGGGNGDDDDDNNKDTNVPLLWLILLLALILGALAVSFLIIISRKKKEEKG